ncbi:MAG: hypothetical protein ACO2PM_13760 [Pyrobaculum sp.]
MCGVAGDDAPVGGFVRLGIFSDSLRFGGVAVVVRGVVPFGVLE